MLGQIPGDEQPSHKYFCSLVTEKLSSFDPSKPVWMERTPRGTTVVNLVAGHAVVLKKKLTI
jgi:tRNA 2-selenouridine synthase